MKTAEQMRAENAEAFANLADAKLRLTFPQADWDAYMAKHFSKENFPKVWAETFEKPGRDELGWKDWHRLDELDPFPE